MRDARRARALETPRPTLAAQEWGTVSSRLLPERSEHRSQVRLSVYENLGFALCGLLRHGQRA
jgi:hypothetical protein